MRRLAPSVFLALLAACTVTTTGAPCTSDLNCPSDQGCGSDGACSSAALSCPGHTEEGECVPGTSCASGRLVTCSAASGVCSTGPVETDCPAHQQCATIGGSGSCACIPSRCTASTSSYCAAGGEVVTCAQDTSNPKGCWYGATTTTCTDPGKACAESGGSAACACPTASACPTLDALQCSATGDQVLRCLPSVAGSACLTWQATTDCAASGLVCGAGACVCPANPGPVFVADAIGGSPAGAAPHATGLLAPTACRFQTLTEALAAAGRRGAGSRAMAAGWSAAVPGGVVVFSEPGGLTVDAGVTLSTDDPTPTTGHYAITSAASVPGALVAIGPGGAMSGFELRNAASNGDGVKTACPTSADALAVSLSTVRITAAAAGPPAARLAAGIHVSGYCGAGLADVTVEGAATGIRVEPAAPAVETTASSLRVTGSTVAGVAVSEGRLTVTGGSVDANAAGVLIGTTGAGAPTFSPTGTVFSGNAGDAIYVARGTLVSDGCPFANNGTHVHAQPVGGASVNVTVQNSSGAAKMTGATNSAFRLLAMGAGSTLVLSGNEVVGNNATQYVQRGNGSEARRRHGVHGAVPGVRRPSEGTSSSETSGTKSLSPQAPGTLDLRGGSACGIASRTRSLATTRQPRGRALLKRRALSTIVEPLDPTARRLFYRFRRLGYFRLRHQRVLARIRGLPIGTRTSLPLTPHRATSPPRVISSP